jgi:hypothetical protein
MANTWISADVRHKARLDKVTIRPQISGTALEIKRMSRTDFVPDLLSKLMQFEKEGTGIAQSV